MDDRQIKQAAVETAEVSLLSFLDEIKQLEVEVRATKGPEKRELRKKLEEKRIRFSVMASSIVLFKAKYGISTSIKKLT
jgi:hypothetical protein